MERVILVLAMLAGLHLILSFLQFAMGAIRGNFMRIPPQAKATDVVADAIDVPTENTETDWQEYDIPAYMRRQGIGNNSGSKATASFEVLA